MRQLSSNYIGRVSDINIFGADADTRSKEATLGFGSGSVVAGPYKEAQKFLRVLLSNKGTLLGQPTYGTDLYKKLIQGVILNEAQFKSYFSAAKAKALDFLYNSTRVDGGRDPRFLDDEMITNVSIQGLYVTPGTAKVTFKFTYKDNTGDLIIPVEIPVGV